VTSSASCVIIRYVEREPFNMSDIVPEVEVIDEDNTLAGKIAELQRCFHTLAVSIFHAIPGLEALLTLAKEEEDEYDYP
jgi:hypothetical protein